MYKGKGYEFLGFLRIDDLVSNVAVGGGYLWITANKRLLRLKLANGRDKESSMSSGCGLQSAWLFGFSSMAALYVISWIMYKKERGSFLCISFVPRSHFLVLGALPTSRRMYVGPARAGRKSRNFHAASRSRQGAPRSPTMAQLPSRCVAETEQRLGGAPLGGDSEGPSRFAPSPPQANHRSVKCG